MSNFYSISTLLIVLTVLVSLTSIITGVIKKITWDTIPSSLLAFIVSQVLTILTFFIYMSYYGYPVLWYHIVTAVILGFMVSYAAMFGFDKLKEIIMTWKTPTSITNTDNTNDTTSNTSGS